MLKLNLIHTVAFSGIVLFMGYGLRRLVRPLEQLNIPAPAELLLNRSTLILLKSALLVQLCPQSRLLRAAKAMGSLWG